MSRTAFARRGASWGAAVGFLLIAFRLEGASSAQPSPAGPPPKPHTLEVTPPVVQPPAGTQVAPPGPAQPAPEAPAPTRATFVSTSSQQWDVAIDGQPVCGTPCSLPLVPFQFVTLKSQEPNPVILDVGRLPPGDLIVSGKPLEDGKYAGGIVATTFGGMAAVVGITLGAVGFAKDRGGMATAGLITGGAGAVALAGGIYLMLKAVPSVSIDRASYASSTQVGLAGTF